MTRIRLVLVALFICLAIPVAVLVIRARDGIAIERAARHKIVADRIFEEMERALSQFLDTEERRPIESYSYYSTPGTSERSPLSMPSDQSFVVAHFEVDTQGSVHSPLASPQTDGGPGQTDPIVPTPDILRRLRLVDDWVAPFWRSALRRSSTRSDPRQAREQPGSGKGQATGDRPVPSSSDPQAFSAANTLPREPLLETGLDEAKEKRSASPRGAGNDRGGRIVDQVFATSAPPSFEDLAETDAAAAPEAALKEAKIDSAYSVLSKLNAAGLERQDRKATVQRKRRDDIAQLTFEDEEASAPARGAASQDEIAEAVVEVEREAKKEDADTVGRLEPRASPSPRAAQIEIPEQEDPYRSRPLDGFGQFFTSSSSESARVETRDETPAPPSPETIEIVLEPMTGVDLPGGRMILFRTVLVDQVGLRQGLLIDRGRLGKWLGKGVLERLGGGSKIAIDFSPSSESDGLVADHYQFAHAFAPPFQSLVATVRLEPLEGAGEAETLYGLAMLVAIMAALGLIAVDRMTNVTVAFAERRSNFVAAVTHELKTPLTAIRMYGEMLRDGLAPHEEKRQEYYATIAHESERLSRLIDNVLEFSRLEKGSRSFEFLVGDVGPVAQEVVDRLRPHAAELGFELSIEADPDLPPVRFDRDALTQMLFNLIDNAMKYARSAQSKRIVVKAESGPDGGVQLSVRDFGPGVGSRHLKRIFEPFFREEAELTRSTQGSGIGLALVKELGEGMEAKVFGRNSRDGGFMVQIAFRAARAPNS